MLKLRNDLNKSYTRSNVRANPKPLGAAAEQGYDPKATTQTLGKDVFY